MVNSHEESWFAPIVRYLNDGTLPLDKKDARKLTYKAAQYTLVDGVLYKRGFTTPLLRCVDKGGVSKFLQEIHEGECGNHAGGQSTAKKAIHQGYYWPTMEKDASDFARRCDKYQRHANYPQQSPNELVSMTSPWPFTVWGIELIGALPTGRGGAKYAVVAVDYFTKWVEAEPLVNIKAKQITTFVNKYIVCRFGVPYKIISDNGTHFEGGMFEEYCQEKGIKRSFSAIVHPQDNGQVEAINKILKRNLKTKLEKLKRAWVEELPNVLWAYKTTPRSTTWETPFALAYECEAVLSIEMKINSIRTQAYDD